MSMSEPWQPNLHDDDETLDEAQLDGEADRGAGVAADREQVEDTDTDAAAFDGSQAGTADAADPGSGRSDPPFRTPVPGETLNPRDLEKG